MKARSRFAYLGILILFVLTLVAHRLTRPSPIGRRTGRRGATTRSVSLPARALHAVAAGQSLDEAWTWLAQDAGGVSSLVVELENLDYQDASGADLRVRSEIQLTRNDEAVGHASLDPDVRLYGLDKEGLAVLEAWPSEAGHTADQRLDWAARGRRLIFSERREQVRLKNGDEWSVEHEDDEIRALRPVQSQHPLLCETSPDTRQIACRCLKVSQKIRETEKASPSP